MSILAVSWSLPLAQFDVGDATSHPATATQAAPSAAPAPAAQNVVQSGSAAPTTQGGTTVTSQPVEHGGGFFLGGIVLMFVVLYLVLFRGQKKDEKRRKALLSEMKKGDRVMTIGGLIGRIVSIDNDEVVLKIDESANVKATYKKSSIQQVLTPGEEKTK